MIRELDKEVVVVGPGDNLLDLANAIHMARHLMATHFVPVLHRPLDVNPIAKLQVPQIRPHQGLLDAVEGDDNTLALNSFKGGDGETGPVDGDAGPDLQSRRRDLLTKGHLKSAQPRDVADTNNFAQSPHNSSEHPLLVVFGIRCGRKKKKKKK